MLENEFEAITTELIQIRESTNTRKSYPKELKQRITSLLDKGLSIKKVSDATGFHSTTLGKWKAPKENSPFIDPQIIQNTSDSGNITLSLILAAMIS